MTELLEQAFAQAAKLSAEQQNEIAKWLMNELSSADRWSCAFANSQDQLAKLAHEALEEHQTGATHDLEPDKL